MRPARATNNSTPQNERLEGKVKWFSDKKGYGFIKVEGEKDVFVHIRHVKRSGLTHLLPGQRVKFDLHSDRRERVCATNIRTP